MPGSRLGWEVATQRCGGADRGCAPLCRCRGERAPRRWLACSYPMPCRRGVHAGWSWTCRLATAWMCASLQPPLWRPEGAGLCVCQPWSWFAACRPALWSFQRFEWFGIPSWFAASAGRSAHRCAKPVYAQSEMPTARVPWNLLGELRRSTIIDRSHLAGIMGGNFAGVVWLPKTTRVPPAPAAELLRPLEQYEAVLGGSW